MSEWFPRASTSDEPSGARPTPRATPPCAPELAELLRGTPDPAVVVDGEGVTILFVNEPFARRVGLGADELVGRRWADLVPSDVAESRLGHIRAAVASRKAVDYEDQRAGRTLEHRAIPIASGGAVNQVVCFTRDVTDARRRAAQLAAAQRITRTGSWELDLATSEVSCSDEVYRICELEPAHFPASYEGFLSLTHPDDRAAVGEALERSAATGGSYEIEHRLLMPDGRIKWVRQRGSTTEGSDGWPVRAVGTIQDVTDQHRAAAELRTLRERLALVFENTTDLQGLLRVEGDQIHVEAVNRAARETVSRFGMEVAAGRALFDIQALTRGNARLPEVVHRVARTGKAERYEVEHVLPLGTLALEAVVVPLPTESSTARYVLWSARDLTAQHRDRAELRLHSEILLAMGEGALLLDEAGTIVFANRTLHEMFGYPPGELVGEHVRALSGPPDAARATDREGRARVSASGVFEEERTNRRKDGTSFVSRARITSIQRGEQRLFVNILADVTSQRRTEEQLRASLREKETLLREVHHRVKNNLQIVCSLLALQRGASPNEAAARVILDCEERVRAIALIHELLYQAEDLAEVDLGVYARKVVSAIATAYAQTLAFTVFAEAGLGVGLDAAVPLGFVLHELVSNTAKHAFPPGRPGCVQVRLSRTDEALALEVEDDGVGLPPDWASRVPDRLGLSLVRALAEQLGGRFALGSGVVGTVARLDVPLHGRTG